MPNDHEHVLETRIRLGFEVDPLLTLGPLKIGPFDPQMRFEGHHLLRATRTVAGGASVRLAFGRGEVRVEAWGPGAAAAIDELPALLGAADEPAALVPRHALVAELARRLRGARMTRTGKVLETLVPSIIAQKVTRLEAWRTHRALLERFGERAPGPLGLLLPPASDVLAGQPYYAFHEVGLERRRAEAIRHVGRLAPRLEAAAALAPSDARRRLVSVPGIGPWTAAETIRIALGDPDAVSIGDYNLPHLVCWALAGERRSNDERMLELLAPYAGQRARVVRLIELSRLRPPRRGPRLAPRAIAAM